MRARGDFLDGLLELHGFEDRSDRRGVFRQSITSLAVEASLDGPPPLDGLSPDALLGSIRVALADGLFDDLGWLAPSASAVALYEIAGALPLGPERRELGRRVLAQLYEGNASTFVAIATRMALGSARGPLGAPGPRPRRARRSAPAATSTCPSIRSRSRSSRAAISRAIGSAARSTASLPERRLAARLLERAAREAVAPRVPGRRPGAPALPRPRLRGARAASRAAPPRRDRRGLPPPARRSRDLRLAPRRRRAWPALRLDPRARTTRSARMLSPDLSPTEWRRAATSLVASIAVDPERDLVALPRAARLGADAQRSRASRSR